MNQTPLCVIPARSGSKRIPGKNTKDFAGLPMITRALALAHWTGLFETIYVSTDDKDLIARCDPSPETHVPVWINRPADLANDHATTAQVMQHALEQIRRTTFGELGDRPVCCLYPCTPLAKVEDMRAGLDMLLEQDCNYVMPITRFQPQRAMRVDPDGSLHQVWPQFANVRTQDLEPRWRDAGQWYWGKAIAWREMAPIYGHASRGYEIPASRAIDIDTPDDWAMAEAVYLGAGR